MSAATPAGVGQISSIEVLAPEAAWTSLKGLPPAQDRFQRAIHLRCDFRSHSAVANLLRCGFCICVSLYHLSRSADGCVAAPRRQALVFAKLAARVDHGGVGQASFGSRAAVAGRQMAQPVYPQLRKYPVRSGNTLRANAQSRCAPARCAGARAERPEGS